MNWISMSAACHYQTTIPCQSRSPLRTLKQEIMMEDRLAIFRANRSRRTLYGRRSCISHSLSCIQCSAASLDFSWGHTLWIKFSSDGFLGPGWRWRISLWLEITRTGTSKTWRQDRQLRATQFTIWSAREFSRHSRSSSFSPSSLIWTKTYCFLAAMRTTWFWRIVSGIVRRSTIFGALGPSQLICLRVWAATLASCISTRNMVANSLSSKRSTNCVKTRSSALFTDFWSLLEWARQWLSWLLWSTLS